MQLAIHLTKQCSFTQDEDLTPVFRLNTYDGIYFCPEAIRGRISKHKLYWRNPFSWDLGI